MNQLIQKLLIALSSFIDRLIKKPEPKMEPEDFYLGGSPVGAFMNQVNAPLEYYIESIYDQHSDYYIKIQYVCACGEQVFRMLGDGQEFGCDHCDSVCVEPMCKLCYNLMSVDHGAPGGEHDSDL